VNSIIRPVEFLCMALLILVSCNSESSNARVNMVTSPDSLKNSIYKAHYVDSVLKYDWLSCRMRISYSDNRAEEELFMASATYANELIFKKDSTKLKYINGDWQGNENGLQNIKDQAFLWQYYLLAPYKLSESDKIWSVDTLHILHDEEWLCAHYHHSSNPDDIYFVFTDLKHHIIKAIGLDSKDDKNDFIILYESYTMESSGLFPNRWLLCSWSMNEGLKEKLGEVELYSYQLSDFERVLELSTEF